MPARYFFLNFTEYNAEKYTSEFGKSVAVEITGNSAKGNLCRIWVNTLDRKDGTFIVRYKLYETCINLSISIYYKSKHIHNSPIKFQGPIQPDQCVCPENDFNLCNDTVDIVMPTYDITESALENMGRVTLDTLSVQGNVEQKWEDRKPIAFWRGRDSREERLKLVDIARVNPDLFNVSLTNFFFYRDKEAQYGPKQPHISFFKFFDYKYQINVDGTVAAYRYPYLLAGGGMVLKQESPFYEHFYHQLREWEHYVPVASDLSNLVERIKWARNHDKEAHDIANNARKFASENLLPQNIICYHAILLSEWSKKISSKVIVLDGMTHIPQPKFQCDCQMQKKSSHEEL
ncbi:unnamed protein product, partial [Iphiclides podalirius]